MFHSKKINSNLVYYSDLIPELEHFFTTREFILHSNNCNTDTQKLIDKNINTVCAYLDIERENFISPEQVHSAHIEFVKQKKSYPKTDALILTDFIHAIYLNFADCVPVILYDKHANIGGLAHAGRRGTAAEISVKTLKKMLDYTGSDLVDIYAVIGAAISDCCYEVGKDVAEEIKNSVNNPNGFIKYKNNSTYVDLKSINAHQLIEAGLSPENIDICPFCTSCRNDLFFSYRKEHGTPNRHSAVIKLK